MCKFERAMCISIWCFSAVKFIAKYSSILKITQTYLNCELNIDKFMQHGSKSSTRKAQPVAASLSSSSTSAFAPFLRLLDLGEISPNIKTSENIYTTSVLGNTFVGFVSTVFRQSLERELCWDIDLFALFDFPDALTIAKELPAKCAHQSVTRSFQAAKWRFVGFPMNHLDRLDMDMARLYIVYECTPSIGVSQEAQRKKPEGHISMPASDIRYQLIRTKADSNLLEFSHCNSPICCHGRTIWQYLASCSYIFGPRMDERHIRNWRVRVNGESCPLSNTWNTQTKPGDTVNYVPTLNLLQAQRPINFRSLSLYEVNAATH